MAQRQRVENVTIENTRIMFRNFAGAESQFNAKGKRNFAVPLDPEIATKMIEDGWNVKQLRPREEGDQPQDYVQVEVSYKQRPPRIVMITSRGRTALGEDEIDILDYVDIKEGGVDLILNPSFWEVNGKSGIKAYLKSIFITINEDELDLKYADVPEAPSSAASAREYTPED